MTLKEIKESRFKKFPSVDSKFLKKDTRLIINTVRLTTRRLGLFGLSDTITVKAGHPRKYWKVTAWAKPWAIAIFVNKKDWLGYSRNEKRGIIAHEVCHLIDSYVNNPRRHHGKSFFKLLKKSGFLPLERKFHALFGPAWYVKLIPGGIGRVVKD